MDQTIDHELMTDVMQLTEAASFGIKLAVDAETVRRQQLEKAAGFREPLLKELKAAGLLKAGQEQGAAAMFSSLPETLSLFLKFAGFYRELQAQKSEKQAGEPGSAVAGEHTPLGNGKAAYDSLNDPHVGRKTSQKKASDIAMLKVLDPPA